ncbi:hypothetical protein ASPZODRAFT_71725 [Penicilliopsis zonata CBS 506.65]|uniref:Uncharacterized protein n=1 Tax=Penicilliopsis zonata CBS 506.65 TaxID=1073090 RepID=A0A1L9SAW2_9EURO|nr:hypothetical protein ASPZODRAFT_71725 [Penicilliopsis zonata CBS 506.65]OJJ44288.1 hypothetical protein ASPZODRAFT_71725 [Penicilliopsis zonata CBS 506.65]
MCPMLLSRLSDGPALVLSPPQEHAFVQFPASQPARSFQSQPAGPGSSLYPNPGFNALSLSRKRSRDEVDDGEPSSLASSYAATATAAATKTASSSVVAPRKEEEPIYGEGMVLLNPRTGLALSAESQTGTWYEEKVESIAAAAPAVSSRSSTVPSSGLLPSRKSQRLDTSAPGLDDIALSAIRNRTDTPADQATAAASSSGSGPMEPQVDDATRLLGISWQRICDDDTDIAAAVRGWKKYIDNQYAAHLHDSHILLKNRALNAYLVAAQPVGPSSSSSAFYLFSEDLDTAQLVGSTWEICLHNLRSVPLAFEGTQVLRAADKNTSTSSSPLDSNPPLLQSVPMPTYLSGNLGMTEGVGMGTGMDIDS